MKSNYVRVGTMYYKKVMVPLISGDKVEKLIPWTGECIKLDHGQTCAGQCAQVRRLLSPAIPYRLPAHDQQLPQPLRTHYP
ncbi:MAG: hypothetical protein U5K79_16820 [Cyclobacteriaceae bacterium]|nr:hypothetical protein [Cyclobacteriaceae bacterium]